MTTHELREQLEGLAIKWSEEANGFADDFNGNDVSNAKMNALDSCADELLSLLSEMGDGWIPVEPSWPPPDTTVLLYAEKGGVEPGYWDAADEDETWYTLDSRRTLRNVTHWQPLPEGPKG